MRRISMLVVAVAIVASACSGDTGISAEQHAQVLAELTLAQQDLADLRTAGAARAASEAEARLAEWQAVVDEAIAEIGLLPDPGRDPIEQLVALTVDLHADEERRQAEMDAAVEELDAELRRLEAERSELPTPTTLIGVGPGGGTGLDSTTVSNRLVLISQLATISVGDADALAGLGEIAAGTGNPDIVARLDELVALAPESSPDEFGAFRDDMIRLLADELAAALENG